MTIAATEDRRTGVDRRSTVRTIAHLRAHLDGEPFSVAELAALIGNSPSFIRQEIKGGQIPKASETGAGWFRIGRGKERDYRIEYEAARVYVLALIRKG